jgi:hypothetical protein
MRVRRQMEFVTLLSIDESNRSRNVYSLQPPVHGPSLAHQPQYARLHARASMSRNNPLPLSSISTWVAILLQEHPYEVEAEEGGRKISCERSPQEGYSSWL